jgi:hypothetical protein
MKKRNIGLVFNILLAFSTVVSVPQILVADEYQDYLIYRCPFDSIVYHSPKMDGEQFGIDLINDEVTGSEELYEKGWPIITQAMRKVMRKATDHELPKIRLLRAQRWPELWVNKNNGRGILFLTGSIKGPLKLGVPRIQSGGRQYRARMRKSLTGSSVMVHLTEDRNINAKIVGSWGALVGTGNCKKLALPYGPRSKEGYENLPLCEGTPTSEAETYNLWDNCKGEATLTPFTVKGKTVRGHYEGSWIRGRYSGWGNLAIEIEDDSKKETIHYEGQIRKGKLHGYGTKTDQNGIKQSGLWKGGKYLGKAQRGSTLNIKKNAPLNRKSQSLDRIALKPKASDRTLQKLKIIKNLLEEKLITPEEAATKRQKILDDMTNRKKQLSDHQEKPIINKSFQEGVDSYNQGKYRDALAIWKVLAVEGSVAAQYNLGQIFVHGKGVSRNYQEALKWYKMAAENGDAASQFSVGLMYRKGHGVIKDRETAMEWWGKAAAQRFRAHGRGTNYQPGIRETN